jgi:hypothetical protein
LYQVRGSAKNCSKESQSSLKRRNAEWKLKDGKDVMKRLSRWKVKVDGGRKTMQERLNWTC